MLEDKDFHAFFGNIPGKLSEEEMVNSFPVHCTDTYTDFWLRGSEEVKQSGINWVLHSTPYLDALDWFEAMHRHRSDDFATLYFATAPLLQRTIIQRGYEIRYEDAYPPLLEGNLYDIELQSSDETSIVDFPVSRLIQVSATVTGDTNMVEGV